MCYFPQEGLGGTSSLGKPSESSRADRAREGRRQALIWLGVSTLLGIAFGLFFGHRTGHYAGSFIISFGISYTIWFFNALIFSLLVPRLQRFPRRKQIIFESLAILIADLSGFILPMALFSHLFGFEFFQARILFINIGVFMIFFLFIMGLAYSFAYYREVGKREMAEERFRALAARAELKALQAQINPHFLFNALNTISSLIDERPEKAQETIEKLADVFRYTLSASDKEFVMLREELEFIDSYLEIEKARFGSTLQVHRSIDPQVENVLIPSLILQPLVENAIKHGRNSKGEAYLEISAWRVGSRVQIEVADQGKGIPNVLKDKIFERGTGLRNVAERLRLIYGKDSGFDLQPNSPRGTRVVITIPGERP